jgi:hypothetical protein
MAKAVSFTTKVEPSATAKVVTAVVVGTAGLVLVRRLPRVVRRPAEFGIAAATPWIASYLTQLEYLARDSLRRAPLSSTGLRTRPS